MKLVSLLIVCSALAGCATDYASQLSDANFGRQPLNSEENVDPTLLMNGVYNPMRAGAFCLSQCASQAPLWASGWAP
jgi:hypothetical protein